MALKCFVYVKNSAALKNNLELNRKLVYRPDHPTQTAVASFDSTLEDVYRSMVNPTTITYPCSVFGSPSSVVSGTPPNTTTHTLYGSDDIITIVYDKNALKSTFEQQITSTRKANFTPDDLDLRSSAEGMFHYISKILLYCYNFPSEIGGASTSAHKNFLDRVLKASNYASTSPRTGADATHWDKAFQDRNFKGKYVEKSADIPRAVRINSGDIVEVINYIDIKFNFDEKHPNPSATATAEEKRVKFELGLKAYYNPDEFIKQSQENKRLIYLYEDMNPNERTQGNKFNDSHQVSKEDFEKRIIESLHKGLNRDKNNYKHFESYSTRRIFPGADKSAATPKDIEGTDVFWIFHSYKNKYSDKGGASGSRPTENTIKSWIQHYLKNDSTTHAQTSANKKDNKWYSDRWPELFSNSKIIIWPIWKNKYNNSQKHIISIKDLRDEVQRINVVKAGGTSNIGTDYVEVFYVGNQSTVANDFPMPILCFDANDNGKLKTPLHDAFRDYYPASNITNTSKEKGHKQFQFVLIEALKICAPIKTGTILSKRTTLEETHDFHIEYGGKDKDFKVRFEFNGKKYYVQSSTSAEIPTRIPKEATPNTKG